MAEKKQNKYTPQKSYIKIKGIINGLTSGRTNFGYKEGKTQKGVPYRSLRFNLKTSESNNLTVEMFGMVKKNAYFYNKTTKESKAVSWDKRLASQFKGFEPIKEPYDTILQIAENFKDGDSVVVIGTLEHSEYLNEKTGQIVPQTRYTVSSIYPENNPIEFDDEDYKEEAIFEQELIIREFIDIDDKLILMAYVIDYGDIFVPVQFEVSQKSKQFVANMKRLPFGTAIKVGGVLNNRAIVENIATDDGWGEQVRTITRVERSMLIVGANPQTIIKGAYTEQEIAEAIAAREKRTVEQEKDFNPQKKNDDFEVAEDDDELPFDI